MSSFGLSFTGDFSGMPAAPRGFAPARLTIGSFSERIFSDITVWRPDQYRDHWKITAEKILKTLEPGAFCSSFGKKNADLWVAYILEGEVVLHSISSQRSDLSVSGLEIEMIGGLSEFTQGAQENWSTWRMPSDYLKNLVAAPDR